jgi:hypothetical protein
MTTATTKGNPDTQLHVFNTFMGLPPDANDPPVCGAVLTSAYNGRNAPKCPACMVVLMAARLKGATS